jgi:hypothetical protein
MFGKTSGCAPSDLFTARLQKQLALIAKSFGQGMGVNSSFCDFAEFPLSSSFGMKQIVKQL